MRGGSIFGLGIHGSESEGPLSIHRPPHHGSVSHHARSGSVDSVDRVWPSRARESQGAAGMRDFINILAKPSSHDTANCELTTSERRVVLSLGQVSPIQVFTTKLSTLE